MNIDSKERLKLAKAYAKVAGYVKFERVGKDKKGY